MEERSHKNTAVQVEAQMHGTHFNNKQEKAQMRRTLALGIELQQASTDLQQAYASLH